MDLDAIDTCRVTTISFFILSKNWFRMLGKTLQ
jgi:hypothetical protein